MSPLEAISAIQSGRLVECDADEYQDIRGVLQKQAGKWIDTRQDIYAQIALLEVKRLDDKFK